MWLKQRILVIVTSLMLVSILLVACVPRTPTQTPTPVPTPTSPPEERVELTLSTVVDGVPPQGSTLEVVVYPNQLKLVLGPVSRPEERECEAAPCWKVVVLLPCGTGRPVSYEIQGVPTSQCIIATYQAQAPLPSPLDEAAINDLIQQLLDTMGLPKGPCCEGIDLTVIRP